MRIARIAGHLVATLVVWFLLGASGVDVAASAQAPSPVPQEQEKAAKSARPDKPRRGDPVGTKDGAPKKAAKPTLSPACQLLVDSTHQELARIKAGISELKGTTARMKAAHLKLGQSMREHRKAQPAKQRASGARSIEGSEASSGPSGVTGSSSPPEGLKAQVAVKEMQGQGRIINTKMQEASRDLERAKGQIGELRKCSAIPSSTMRPLLNDAKAIRSQIKTQASSVRSLSGADGAGGRCTGRASADCDATACYSCCAAITDPFDRAFCDARCAVRESTCLLQNGDRRAEDLYGILSDLVKQLEQQRGSQPSGLGHG